tara:strand:- start:68 stop:463 length:396 start_codon:yes stop_codon:yes gene_type:complete
MAETANHALAKKPMQDVKELRDVPKRCLWASQKNKPPYDDYNEKIGYYVSARRLLVFMSLKFARRQNLLYTEIHRCTNIMRLIIDFAVVPWYMGCRHCRPFSISPYLAILPSPSPSATRSPSAFEDTSKSC